MSYTTEEQKIVDEVAQGAALALGASLSSFGPASDDNIRTLLHKCLDAETHLSDELDRISALPEESDLDGLIKSFYTDLVTWQVQHSAKVAIKRLDHLDYLNHTGNYKAEMKKCSTDTVHWFEYWAFTYDPRPDSPVSDFPFSPFEYQKEVIRWLDRQVFLLRQGGVIEKSRDMGASWTILDWNLHKWLYVPGYAAMLGSRKEDYVDKRGDMGSLFEKIRYQIRLTPEWMLPKGFDPTSTDAMPFMKLVNPENGATLVGESSNADFGRGGRYTAVFVDEFAAFPAGGTEAYTALSQSSRCNFFISTPKGKNNKFAELRFSNSFPVFTIKWEQHPWKDDRWLSIERTRMNEVELAQEIFLDYEASLSGRIFKEWKEIYHVITWEEFADYFGPAARDDAGRPRIPQHWLVGRGMDWGNSLDHPVAGIYTARPGQGDRLNNCVFVVGEVVHPVPGDEDQVTPARIAERMKRRQKELYLSEGRFSISIMSHEQPDVQASMLIENPPHLRMMFDRWKPDRLDGIGVLQQYMQIDPKVKHPFRPWLDGCPRIFFVIHGDPKEIILTDALGNKVLKPATDAYQLARLRYEIPIFHFPKDTKGQEKEKPFALENDAIDALRKLAANWFPPPAAKGRKQIQEEKLPQHLREETLKEEIAEDKPDLEMLARKILTRQVLIKEKGLDYDDSQGVHWRDKLFRGRE